MTDPPLIYWGGGWRGLCHIIENWENGETYLGTIEKEERDRRGKILQRGGKRGEIAHLDGR